MTVYIYALIDPVTSNPRYVGKTNNPKNRLSDHCLDLRATRKSCWIKSLKKHSRKPTLSILEIIQNSDDKDWQIRERFWIRCFQKLGFDLTNLDSGGRNGKTPSVGTRQLLAAGRIGKKHSQSTRAKISASKVGIKMPPRSMEHRQKLSRALVGRPLTAEHCRKITLRQIGRKLRPEWRAKIGASLMGRRNSPETLRKMSASASRRWQHFKQFGVVK